MDSNKQQLAAAVKEQVESLRTAVEQAEAAGLTVELTTPTNYDLAHRGQLAVEVSEKLTY